MYFQVDAPSSNLIRTAPSESGSKLRAFTPTLLLAVGAMRSQCVTQPQVLHLTNLRRLPPHEYALSEPGAPSTRTSDAL